MLADLDRHDAAIGAYQRTLAKDAAHATAWNNLGLALTACNRLPEAIESLRKAIALRPDSSEAHYHLAVALWYSSLKERAAAELRESVKLDPAAGESHAFLGTVLRERGDWAGARASLQRANLPSMANPRSGDRGPRRCCA